MRDSLTPEEVSFLVDRYDEEIRFTDDGIGRLLSALDELGLADETVVVLTADHGEEFLERGWLGHTRTLYEELVRVPLIVRDPSQQEGGRVVPHPVSTVSIAPSLLEWLDVDAPDVTFEVPPLSAAAPNTAVHSEVAWRPVGKLHKLGPVTKTAIIEERYKLVRDASGEVEIYDLEEDPRETRTLRELDPDVRHRLQDELRPTSSP
jgi:arylsulfatase A-like enzyme